MVIITKLAFVQRMIPFLIMSMILPVAVCSQNLKDPSNSESQQLIKGKILNQANGERIPYVHVINKNSRRGTYSNENGEFEIPINPQDTLILSAVGYKTRTFNLLPRNLPLEKIKITIYLDIAFFELSTVEIYPFKDEAAFKQEILNLELPEEKKFTIQLPNSEKPLPANLAPSLAISGPISAIQNLFSKEAKELRKYSRALEDAPNQEIIRMKFNSHKVAEITGLKNEELNEFILFCSVSDEFILKNEEYEIAQKIMACLKNFTVKEASP